MAVSNSSQPQNAHQILNILGRGSFGKVYLAKTATNRYVAVKMIDLSSDEPIHKIAEELQIMTQLRHENIVQYMSNEVHDHELWITMEYCAAGSCSSLIAKYGPFKEDGALYILHEVCNGLVYLHEQNTIHRDLKSANILVTDLGQIKLADFGVSARVTRSLPQRESFMGTPYWMAPEVIQRQPYSKAVDIWGFGIVAIELVTGQAPLSSISPLDAMMRIVNCNPPRFIQFQAQSRVSSSSYGSLVDGCLKKNPTFRPTAKKILEFGPIKSAAAVPQSLMVMVNNATRAMNQLAKTPVSLHRQNQPTSNGDWTFDFNDPNIAAPVAAPSATSSKGSSPIGGARRQASHQAPVVSRYLLRPVTQRSNEPRAHAAARTSPTGPKSPRRVLANENLREVSKLLNFPAIPDSCGEAIERAMTRLLQRSKDPAVTEQIRQLSLLFRQLQAAPGFSVAYCEEMWRAFMFMADKIMPESPGVAARL